jgi:hypothetical protein
MKIIEKFIYKESKDNLRATSLSSSWELYRD